MAASKFCQISPFGLVSRRYYGTTPVCPDDQGINTPVCPDGEGINTVDLIYTEGFDGMGPGDSLQLMKEIKAAASKHDIRVSVLQTEFERKFRPLLASNCLLVPYGIKDDRSAFLHGQMHGFTKQDTFHLTSLDVMLRNSTMKEDQRNHLIDFLIKRRIVIHDEWEVSYGNVEILEYLFEETDSSFVRAECDASFDDSSKVAKLSIIIWQGKKIVWAEVFDGVSCTSSQHAEVLAAIAVLKKCEKSKHSKVKLWSDSPRVVGVINGSDTIQLSDPDIGTYLLLRSAHTEFTTLIAVRKPRESMFLADELLRLQGSNTAVDDAIKMHSPYLRGCPHFIVTHNSSTNKEIRGFGKKLAEKKRQMYNYSLEDTYFYRVKNDKLEELQRLARILRPPSIELFRDDRKSMSQHLRDEVARLIGFTRRVSDITLSVKGFAPPDSKKRGLVVVWDASVPRVDYYQPDTCMVILVENDEEIEVMKKNNIKEINAEMFLYLNRVVFQYK